MFKSLTAQLTPDNEGVLVGFMVFLFGIDWKSSLSGFLSFLIGTFGTITALIGVFQPFLKGRGLLILAIITASLTFLSGLGKFWVGLLTKDKGTEMVKLPKVADPVIMSSHEVPDATLPKGSAIVKE